MIQLNQISRTKNASIILTDYTDGLKKKYISNQIPGLDKYVSYFKAVSSKSVQHFKFVTTFFSIPDRYENIK